MKKLLKKIFLLFINVILFPIFLIELLSFLVYSVFNSTQKKSALFCGLEHVINKSAVRGYYLEKEGIMPFFYSLELTGQKNSYNYPVHETPQILVFDFMVFILQIIKIKPVYVEIYFTGRLGSGVRQAFYAFVAKLVGSTVFTVLRGELYYYNEYSKVKKIFIKLTLSLSDKILYRETYMKQILFDLGIDQDNIVFDPNKVRVKNNVNFNRKDKIILFLNGFKKWRRIDIIINAMPFILEKHNDAKFLFVGARNTKEKEKVEKLLKSKNLTKFGDVHFWTENAQKYYEKAKIFVLPADLVYLNFSLLEAMERGTPAIIAKVKDAEKIIENHVDGVICEQNSEKFAKYIVELLDNEEKRIQMAINARKKIEKYFDDSKRMKVILNYILN